MIDFKGLFDIRSNTANSECSGITAIIQNFHNKDLASAFRNYILRTRTRTFLSDVKKEMAKYKNMIKAQDLEQLAAV
ncbi:MAG: hypothetical protein Q7J70_04625 [Thermodesulfovibrionales bacterium]|nr:hypothetical protein [Thermodesulfovibrionales bacterium]